MKAISINLGPGVREMELLPIADTHIGDRRADEDLLRQRIQHIADTPNCYTILNGDLLNNAVRQGVSDIYGERLSPMQAVALACELFGPIKDRILAITDGNHEERTYKQDGIQLGHFIAGELGIADRYSAEAVLLFLRLGRYEHGRSTRTTGNEPRPIVYTIYATHGDGGGRKEGAKVIRLADLAAVVDADIYIHSHTHLPVIMKQGFHRVETRSSTVTRVEKLFVNTGAYLGFGGYAERKGYKTPSLATPIIRLGGTRKSMEARL